MTDRIELLHHGRAQPEAPRVEQEDRRVPARNVALYFGISVRTLDRWLINSELGFPRPLAVNGRRYFRLREVLDWERARADQAA